MATHSSILAYKIPWTEELNGLLSMGSQRVGHEGKSTSHVLKEMEILEVWYCYY